MRNLRLPIALFLTSALVGCGQKLERSAAAVSLPIASQDPLERTEADRSDNWPGWRGINSSGVSIDTGLPVEWGVARGMRWRQPVPGEGNSSPVVWGDHVILTSALGDSAGSKLVVMSFDRRTGHRQWTCDAGTAKDSTHVKNGFASASVVTDGKSVFASFGGAGLQAIDLATGDAIWRADLGMLDHEWGTASSPVLFENLVIQLCDAASGSELRAFDKRTGQPAWRTERRSNGCWSTPVLAEATDASGHPRQELVINGTGVADSDSGLVVAYKPGDGSELWRARGTMPVVCPTAIVGGGLIISTSGRNGPIFAVKCGGEGDVTKENIVWKSPHGGAYVPTGVAYRNRLYLIADGGVISSMNLGSGEPIWRERLKGTFTASLVAAEGHIYATDEYGEITVLAADDKFQVLATNDMQERMLATPAIAGGDLFLRTQSQLYCVAGKANDGNRALTAADR